MEDLTSKIVFGCLCVALLTCFVDLFFSFQHNAACRELGGVPVNGVCVSRLKLLRLFTDD